MIGRGRGWSIEVDIVRGGGGGGDSALALTGCEVFPSRLKIEET